MDTKKSFISVIIPAYQEVKYMRRCLEALVNQTCGLDNFEIIVVDGASTDGTREIISEFENKYHNVKLLDNPKKIAPVAMNIGVENARGEFIVRIDAHTQVNSDYLERCMAAMGKVDADVVGGPMKTRGDGYWGSVISFILSSIFGVGGSFRTMNNHNGYVDTVAFGMYRKCTLDEVRHDERLVRNHDWDLNYRIQQNGGRVYFDSKIRSTYYCADNPIKFLRKAFKDGYWIAAIFYTHSIRHLMPLFFVVGTIFLAGFCYWRRHGLGNFGYVFFPLIVPMLFYGLTAMFFSLGMIPQIGWTALVSGPLMYAGFHISRGLGTLYGILAGVWLRVARSKENE